MEKKCIHCLELKSITDFHRSKINSDGYQGTCKQCRKDWSHKRYLAKKDKIIAYTYKYREQHRRQWLKYTAEYRKKNKESIRVKGILKRYGLPMEEYERILAKQNYQCAICGIKDFLPKVDHDHKTGKVRGILCFNCNCGLGCFKDTTNLLRSAIDYLDAKSTTTDT